MENKEDDNSFEVQDKDGNVSIVLIEESDYSLIPQIIVDAIYDVHDYASSIERWVDLKKKIVLSVRSEYRKLFSRRSDLDLRTWTNGMELQIIAMWKELTGRKLILKDDEGKKNFTPKSGPRIRKSRFKTIKKIERKPIIASVHRDDDKEQSSS